MSDSVIIVFGYPPEAFEGLAQLVSNKILVDGAPIVNNENSKPGLRRARELAGITPGSEEGKSEAQVYLLALGIDTSQRLGAIWATVSHLTTAQRFARVMLRDLGVDVSVMLRG